MTAKIASFDVCVPETWDQKKQRDGYDEKVCRSIQDSVLSDLQLIPDLANSTNQQGTIRG